MRTLVAEYTRAELSRALEEVGIGAGDIVFLHAGLEALGMPRGCATSQEASAMLLRAVRDVIGPAGTMVVPTYTFSFCHGQIFDVQHTPTGGGPWSTSAGFLEEVRRLPEAVRSEDPIHSVAALGPKSRELLADLPPTCFGKDSVHDRFMQLGGKICMVGLSLEEATFRHHVEERVGVPFRFLKLFTGQIRDNGSLRRAGWLYYVRVLADNCTPDGSCLEELARRENVCRAAQVGCGEVLGVDAAAYQALTARELQRDPWYTARGPAGDPAALEVARVGSVPPPVDLAADASMPQMIAALWRLPRDIVSDGYDAALTALARQVPMTIHEYPTGLECWTWIVPEKWTCHEAYLETLDGRRLFSYDENPLHVVSYSLPFDGEVGRDELLQHLHVHPKLPDAIPFVFKYYEREWGLCCSRRLRDSLTDERYRVVIHSDFSYGTLKVGEVVVPGETDESIVLCAHLCHPGMVNDDLTGVVVGIDVMRTLLQRRDRRYTYRFLIVPETIGSVAYLSQHPDLTRRLKGGLFLEMLGRDVPHALQHSYAGNSEVDQCFALAMRETEPTGWTTPFRTLAGNDERQFNAPGVRIPMLQLARQLRPGDPEHPYREYHSSEDTPERIPTGALEASRDLVLRMLDTLEQNDVPVNHFRGEPFCSRYGLSVSVEDDLEAHRALFDILFHTDGRASIAEIAERCGVSFTAVRSVIDKLIRCGLASVAVEGHREGER